MLLLGKFAYDIRRASLHDARLKGILRQNATIYQVTVGLRQKAPLVQVVQNRTDLISMIERWGQERRNDILQKAILWPQVRIFAESDMVYFIYFDKGGIMRDYICVNR